MPVIPAFSRLRQEIMSLRLAWALFQNSLDYIGRPCLEKKKNVRAS
jgi:hypothetical protein